MYTSEKVFQFCSKMMGSMMNRAEALHQHQNNEQDRNFIDFINSLVSIKNIKIIITGLTIFISFFFQKIDDLMNGLPIFNPFRAFGESFRAICSTSYDLNVSNTKTLIVGLTPFKTTSRLRCIDNEFKFDLDYVIKIVDVKFGGSISIFGDELENFYGQLEKVDLNRFMSIGTIVVDTEYYVIKYVGDAFYECCHKNGKKVFKIASASIHKLLTLRPLIEDYFNSLSTVNFLRIFVDIVKSFLKYENESGVQINSDQAIVNNMQIFENVSLDMKYLYGNICFTFPKTIHEMLEYTRSLPN